MSRAAVVVAIQLVIVCSLGGKLLYDRHTRPRAWFKSERYDPNLPIRGRYLSMRMEVNDPRSPEELERMFRNEIAFYKSPKGNPPSFYSFGRECGSLAIRDGKPTAALEAGENWNCDNLAFERWTNNGQTVLRLSEPVLFFIPDTAKDPTRLAVGDELWVLATIPRKGPPRPIALGLKKTGQSEITPLNLN